MAIIGLGIVLYGIYLVSFGMIETRNVDFISPAILQGVITLLGAGIFLFGLLMNRLIATWSGLVILTLFSVLFVFSGGGILIPFSFALLLLQAISAFLARPQIA